MCDPVASPPDTFPFPFPPYDIQHNFMTAVWNACEQGKIGIFESPTGTGKSLSLICGSLTWLQDFQRRREAELKRLLSTSNQKSTESKENDKPGIPDWITNFEVNRERGEKIKELKAEQDAENKIKAELKQNEVTVYSKYSVKRKKLSVSEREKFASVCPAAPDHIKSCDGEDEIDGVTSSPGDDDDMDLLVDDYDAKGDADSDNDEGNDEEHHTLKIYYCSRTHSQLSQFVHEVQKSPFAATTRVTTLGSRQSLCINEAVRKLASLSLINDRCLELQQKKATTKSSKRVGNQRSRCKPATCCPYKHAGAMQSLRVSTLSEVMDIEDVVGCGRELRACPYYTSRLSVPAAHLVVLPYNTLLHRDTRRASNIRLTGNVLVIDEAHNLMETITSVNSVCVTGLQLCTAHSQLSQYMSRYSKRLKARNVLYIRQILHCLNTFIKCLGGSSNKDPRLTRNETTSSKMCPLNDFLLDTRLDNLNLFDVLEYCSKSGLSRKLNGFVQKYQPDSSSGVPTRAAGGEKVLPGGGAGASTVSSFLKSVSSSAAATGPAAEPKPSAQVAGHGERRQMTSPLMIIEALFRALTSRDNDGRVVVHKTDVVSESSIKYLLLNPAVHFMDIVRECRAVILAGGTMQPTSEFKEQLLYAAHVPESRLMEFSCGHVIPDDQLVAVAVGTAPSGNTLDFTYSKREQPAMMSDVARLMINLCPLVPGGVVCFLPSYAYESLVYSHWRDTGLLQSIERWKPVFREPRGSGGVGEVLERYGRAAAATGSVSGTSTTSTQGGKSTNGAILLSVVGGKLSEGINFSDHLARCIVMVGLPYPNTHSTELREKMKYLDQNIKHSGGGLSPGAQHYDNLCMKAVNQSIGRAIRHRGDWAGILLVDHRYRRESVQRGLPQWIRAQLHTPSSSSSSQGGFREVYTILKRFYSDRKRVESIIPPDRRGEVVSIGKRK